MKGLINIRLITVEISCGSQHFKFILNHIPTFDVLLNFKARVAETWIYHGLKIIFLESTVHKLSIDALFVYHYTVHEDKKQVIPGA